MSRTQTSSELLPPIAHASLALAPASSMSVRGQRMAILCLPLSVIALWIGVVLGGSGSIDALGNPIGGDFAMFYVAGQMAGRGEWAGLYDEAFQQARLLELFPSLPSDTYLPYRYPPLVAIVASPLAALPYLPAFALFTCVSLALWVGSISLLTRSLMPRLEACGGTAVLAVACAPVAVQALIDGQASLIWFALAAGCWLCLQQERYVAAGCLLALAACKPNVMLLLAVVLCLRYPRILLGWIPTGLAMLLATVTVAGTETLAAYVELGRQLAWKPWAVETPYWKVQSLLSWTEPILGESARRITMLFGLLAAIAIGIAWRRQRASSAIDARALCAALAVNALLNPYTPVYDLTLLCLGALVCCREAASQNRLGAWLARRDVQCTVALVLLGPIVSQGVARLAECPLQLMPLALVAAGGYWLPRLLTTASANRYCAGA